MSTKFSGIQKVQYAVAGSGSFVDIGVPNSDAEVKTEPKSVETSKGTNLYAGESVSASFVFSDLTPFSTLETGMKNNTEYDIKVIYMDNSEDVIASSVTIIVTKEIKGKVGELNGFKLTFTAFKI